MRSVNQLNSRQSFFVIFFDNNHYPMFTPKKPAETSMLPAAKTNIARLQKWVDGFQGGGSTDPLDSLLFALKLRADAIFLLTDGGFEPQIVQTVTQQNRRKTPINTIGFIHRAGEPLLKEIAKKNHGRYRFVP